MFEHWWLRRPSVIVLFIVRWDDESNSVTMPRLTYHTQNIYECPVLSWELQVAEMLQAVLRQRSSDKVEILVSKTHS